MNLVLKKFHPMASTCVHTIAVCCILLGSAAALAEPQSRSDQGRRDGGQSDNRYEQRQDTREDPRQNQRQDRAYQDQSQGDPRRMTQVRDPDRGDSRRGGRMTADERRDLRRQINEAGQDIYGNPPRR